MAILRTLFAVLGLLMAGTSAEAQSLLELIDSTPEFATVASIVSLLPHFEMELFLHQSGPYTFFLPNNEGFSGLYLNSYLARLLQPGYQMHLSAMIDFQITDMNVHELVHESIENHMEGLENTHVTVEMLSSDTIQLDSVDGSQASLKSALSSAEIVNMRPMNTTDKAIVYATDNLLLPQWMQWNLMSVMENYDWRLALNQEGPMYTRFVQLIVAGDMDDVLREDTAMTLLAPSNKALPDFIMNNLMAPGVEEALSQFLNYHILPQILNIRTLVYEQENVMTRQGEWLEIKSTDRGLLFNHAPLKGMQLTRHGVLYRLGSALIPPSWR